MTKTLILLPVALFLGMKCTLAMEHTHPCANYTSRDTTMDNSLFNASFTQNNNSSIESKKAEHFKYSILYDIPVEMIEDIPLYRFVEEWFGIRYLFGGTSKRGIDCSAFTQRLAKDLYCVDIGRVVIDQYRHCTPIQKSELSPGDLVFFETFQPGLSHVGIYLGDNRFAHASSKKGITVDKLSNPYYVQRYRKSGRIIGKP